MKKVLYFHQYFNTPAMGGSIRSYELAMEMSDIYYVTVITSDRLESSNFVRIENLSPTFRIVWIPNKYSNMMGSVKRIFSFCAFVLKSIKYSLTEKADIVICTSTPLTIAIPGLLHKLRFGSKFIFEVRDSWPKVPIKLGLLKNKVLIFLAQVLEKLTYGYADDVIALSPGMASDVRSVNPTCRITVIPNFCNKIDINQIKCFQFNDDIESGGAVILYAGTFGYVNNMDYIIDLAFALVGYEYKFVLVGDGKYKSETTSRAQRLGLLNRNVFIFDAVDKLTVYSMIKRSDFMISTVVDQSVMWANSANKFFDALAFSKPVIINHGGWLSELIMENNIGLVLDPIVTSSSVEKIIGTSSESRIDMSNGIGILSEGEFSFSSIYTKYEALLERNT